MKSKSKKERTHIVYLHATFDPTYRGVYLQREATKGKGEERDGLQGLCKKRSQRVWHIDQTNLTDKRNVKTKIVYFLMKYE